MALVHRRGGKSVCFILKLILSWLTLKKKNPKFFYMAPLLKQAEEAAWQYVKGFCKNIPGVVISESDLSVTVDLGDGYGDRVLKLVGVSDVGESKRGAYADGVVLDEMGHIKRGVWENVVRILLMDRKGWAVLTGTPAVGYWQEMFIKAKDNPEWHLVDHSDARKTNIIDKDELESAERTTDDLPKFRREMYGEWITGDIGSYYLENLVWLQENGHINEHVSYNPKLPVVVSWDLGLNDYTVAWFAQYDPSNDKIYLIDYYEKRGNIDYRYSLADVEAKGYKIDLMVVPHDSIRRTGVTEDTVKVVFEKKYRVLRIPKTGNKLVDIGIVKNYLHKCEFNSVKCAIGVNALYNYRSALNVKHDTLSQVPIHCDRSDSFRYMIMGMYQARWQYCQFAAKAKPMNLAASEIQLSDD